MSFHRKKRDLRGNTVVARVGGEARADVNSKELQERLNFCRKAVASVVPVVLQGFQNSEIKVEKKRDGTHVTEIDRRVEELLRREVEAAFRGEKIVGEEFGVSGGAGDVTWYIDPIDGTCSFVSGVPLFGTLIGLTYRQAPVLGYVHLPAMNETVYAARGLGCWWKRQNSDTPERARVSEISEMKDAIFSSTSRDGFVQVGRADLYEALCSRFALSRGWSDCYGHILVATGRADLMVDAVCNDWDSVPFLPLLEEAGGIFCDLTGNRTAFGKSMVSVNGNLADPVREVLRG